MQISSDQKIPSFKMSISLLIALFLAGWAAIPVPASAGESFSITHMKWDSDNGELRVRGNGAGKKQTVILKDADSGAQIGTTRSEDDGRFEFEAENMNDPPCRIQAMRYDGITVTSGYTRNAPETCTASGDNPPPSDETASHAGRFTSYDGTATCLTCHTEEAIQVHASVHYQWKGDASETVGLTDTEAGKLGGINDFCIYPDINWIGKLTNINGEQVDAGCAKCHVGLGRKPEQEATPDQLENIDCLVCHSDTYKRRVEMTNAGFRFVPDTEKMTVSLLDAAISVGRPSKDSCLNCHTKAGGGDNFKRGDIEEAHRNPDKAFDVHMASKTGGGAGLTCLDCHTASEHRIAGRGTDLRPRESAEDVSCTRCHSGTPHESRQLDRHTARVNCTVCHIPFYAKNAPTDMERDWSEPGDPVSATGLYEPHHVKGQNVVPEYRFFNGKSRFYQFGDAAEPGENGRVVMSEPEGDIRDPDAKIYAFKHHLGNQPVDPYTRALLPLKIGKFFETGQIEEAVALGTQAVGWTYNGHEFAQTERYMGLFHEVAPKEDALTCNSCHNGGTRIDFAKLGYTPNATYNNRPLCASCHEDESDEWSGSEYFIKVHDKHVDDKGYDCNRCHTFSSAD